MKFVYEYRTSDNAKHKGILSACSREDAFALLKSKGIKASRMAEAPGFFNKLLGKGKRWMLIFILTVCLIATIFYARTTGSRISGSLALSEQTRRQVIGDTVIIERGIKTGWAFVFDQEGERFLASFAIPGAPAGIRNTTEQEIISSLSRKIEATEKDNIETVQIKSMVEGMKNELRNFLGKGGCISRYCERLVKRQEKEIEYYNRAKADLEALEASNATPDEMMSRWEGLNTNLRKMGIRQIPFPEQ